MKLEIDDITEAKIRHYMSIIDRGDVNDVGIYASLQDAAMLIANAMSAKLQTEDVFNTIGNKE